MAFNRVNWEDSGNKVLMLFVAVNKDKAKIIKRAKDRFMYSAFYLIIHK